MIWKLLPDSPETARFLTKDEKELIINRLALETGSGKGKVTNADKIQKKHVIAALKEWKTWAACIMFWGNTIGVYGSVPILNAPGTPRANRVLSFTSTVPTIIEQLGYDSANAQLMTIPIYVFAMIMTIIFAWWGDKAQQRSPFIVAGFSIACVVRPLFSRFQY